MNFFVLFLIYKSIQVVISFNIDDDIDGVIKLTTTEMILKLGYPLEVHTIQTKDGYILDLHRIPHGKNNKTLSNTSPVLMYAGLLGDSASFACWNPESSLAYILADQGYDVWLGNNRGTTHSKRHIKWDPYKNKKKFWNFSFQEMATYDVPESIDYILNITKYKNLYYIGHSQATTVAFAMLAESPTYNKKIRLLTALSPLVNIKHSSVVALRTIIKNFSYFKAIVDKYEYYEVLAQTKRFKELTLLNCNNNSTMQHVCLILLCSFFGCNIGITNTKYLPVALSNLPAGGSVKQIVHYMQLIEGEFKKYDYGKEKNFKIYNSEKPPVYNLTNIRTKTALFYGTGDILAAYQDVEILAPKLPKVIYRKRIEGLNHIDILYAIDSNNLINNDIVKLLKMY